MPSLQLSVTQVSHERVICKERTIWIAHTTIRMPFVNCGLRFWVVLQILGHCCTQEPWTDCIATDALPSIIQSDLFRQLSYGALTGRIRGY